MLGWKREFNPVSIESCAATHVIAAFDPRLDDYNGCYLDQGQLAEPRATASEPEDVEKLWKLSEKLVRESFPY